MMSLIVCAIMMNLCIGTKEVPSIIGIELCSFAFWALQAAFILMCVVYCWQAIKRNKFE
jgi:hypothetical protein